MAERKYSKRDYAPRANKFDLSPKQWEEERNQRATGRIAVRPRPLDEIRQVEALLRHMAIDDLSELL
jgi:hypothetical protein